MEVDLLVDEPARGQEHLERRQAGLEQRQPTLRDERVPAQALDVDRADRDAGQVCVAPDVVEVVDGEDARQERLQPADPERHRGVGEGRLRDEEGDPGRVDALAVGEPVALGDGAGRPSEATQERPELVLDDPLRQVLVGQALVAAAPRVGRGGELGQDLVVEEVGERSMADVVEQAGHPERLDDQALGRGGLARASPARSGGSDRASAPRAPPRA